MRHFDIDLWDLSGCERNAGRWRKTAVHSSADLGFVIPVLSGWTTNSEVELSYDEDF